MLHRHADASPTARAHAVQAKSIVARPGSCIVHPSPVCGAAARQSLEELDLLGEQGPAAYSRTLLAVEAIAGPMQPPAQELLTAARAAFHDADDRWGLALTLFVEMELQFAAGQLESGRPPSSRPWTCSASWATTGASRPSSTTSAWPCIAPGS